MAWQFYYTVIYGLAILLVPAIYPKMILHFKWGHEKTLTTLISVSGAFIILYAFLTPSLYRTILQVSLILCYSFGVFSELFLVEWNFPLPKKQKYLFNIFFALTNLILIIAVVTG